MRRQQYALALAARSLVGLGTLFSLSLSLFVSGCRTTPVSVQELGPLVIAHAPPGGSLAVEAELVEDGIVCRRHLEGVPIHCIAFHRRGSDTAYGVYALWRSKNGLPIGLPLDGNPIAWPNLDHRAALGKLLGGGGVSETAIQQLLEEHGATWFAEGLRVGFVLEPALVVEVLGETTSGASLPALVWVEVPDPGPPSLR